MCNQEDDCKNIIKSWANNLKASYKRMKLIELVEELGIEEDSDLECSDPLLQPFAE